MPTRTHTNVFIIVGGRGTGKTTYVKELVKASSHRRKLVVDTFKNDHYSDYMPLQPQDFARFSSLFGNLHFSSSDIYDYLQYINQGVYNSLVIFEDCLKYINTNPQPEVRSIVLDSKQKGNDVIFVYHSFSQVPPKLATWADYFVIFKTQERIENQKSRLGGIYPIIKPAADKVKASQSKYYKQAVKLY
jgi:GTPase SAR1 family protein